MTAINIKIVSDIVCPFCFIGKRRLEKAIDVYKKSVPGGSDDTFNITWSPFYLDPTLPKTGVPINERMAQRFGPRWEALRDNMRAMGSGDGINFTSKGFVGNTRDAHRLVQLAKTKSLSVQDKVMEQLFLSYFENGGDVTSHDMLIAAAEKGGLDPAEAKAWLAGDSGGPEVDKEVGEAYGEGISGVPNFTINDKFTVSGAQDVSVFLQELVAAKQNSSSGGKAVGPTC